MKSKSTLFRQPVKLFSQIDIFGETASFDIQGHSSVKGVFGALLSLGIAIVILSYGVNKFMILQAYGGTDYQTVTNQNSLDPTVYYHQNETKTDIVIGLLNVMTGESIAQEDYEGYFSWNPVHYKRDGPDQSFHNLTASKCSQQDLKSKLFDVKEGEENAIERFK